MAWSCLAGGRRRTCFPCPGRRGCGGLVGVAGELHDCRNKRIVNIGRSGVGGEDRAGGQRHFGGGRHSRAGDRW